MTRRSLRLWLLTSGGYAAGSLLAWQFLDAHQMAVFFASAGVSSAALLASRPRQWPVALSAVAVTELSLDLIHGLSPGAALGFVAANCLEPLVGAGCVRWWLARTPDLSHRLDSAAFVAGAVVLGPLAGAAVGAGVIASALDRPWGAAFVSYWAGDALGVLTVGGAILAWVRHLDGQEVRRLVPRVGGTAVLAGVGTTVGLDLPRAPLVLPLAALVAAATVTGVTGLMTTSVVVALSANVVSASGAGPWGDLAGSESPGWASIQLLLAVGQLVAWGVAVELARRQRERDALAAEHARSSLSERLTLAAADLSSAWSADEVVRVARNAVLPALGPHAVLGLLTEDGRSLRLTRAVASEDPVDVPISSSHPLARAASGGTRVIAASRQRLSGSSGAGPPDLPPSADVVAIPLVGRTEMTLGALLAVAADGDTVSGLARAELAAELLAGALERARAHEDSRETAHRLQQALLPDLDSIRPLGVQVAAGYRPADLRHEVGGDWYDAFALDDGRIALAVGDVVGHDLEAATIMGKVQPLLRALAHEADDPGDLLTRLDEATAHIGGCTMATVGVADFDPRSRRLRYARAGHPPPLLVSEQSVDFLDGGEGLPLGVQPGEVRTHAAIDAVPGSWLVWFTDGLVEDRETTIMAGLDNLRSTLTGLLPLADPEAVVARLLDQLGSDRSHPDDAVVVCARL